MTYECFTHSSCSHFTNMYNVLNGRSSRIILAVSCKERRYVWTVFECEFNSAHGPRLAYYRPAKGPVLKERWGFSKHLHQTVHITILPFWFVTGIFRFNKLEQNRTNVGLSRLVISKFATAPVGVPPSETSVPLFPPAPITKANPQNNHVNSPGM